jgi:hypothetical protein
MAITPEQASQEKNKLFPDFVIAAFDALIAKNFDGKKSCFLQSDVVKEVLNRWPIDTSVRIRERSNLIFERRYLDVEEIYQRVGWKVEYDKPGYNENYEAKFTFIKRKIKSR